MRRLARCVCLLLLLAQAVGCRSTRQSSLSQHGEWSGKVGSSFTAVFDSVLRHDLEGGTRWEWTQLDYSLDTVCPASVTPRVRITRLVNSATVAARHERVVHDSLAVQSVEQEQTRGERSIRESRRTRTSGLPLVESLVAIAVIISFIYIIKRR